jgi:hypothetical protein
LRLFDQMHALVDAHGDAALFGLTDEETTEPLGLRESLARRLGGVDLPVVRELEGRDVAKRGGTTGTASLLPGHLLVRPGAVAAVDGLLAASGRALSDGQVSF